MNLYKKALRKWWPKRFIDREMTQAHLTYRRDWKSATAANDRRELASDYRMAMQELSEWLTSIEDQEALRRAAKMDIALDDFPEPPSGPGEQPSHWTQGRFGERLLCYETRRALHKATRERAASFRKERRETIELYTKVSIALGTAITGLGGTLIGIISILRK
jgi:hypothetical protein